MATSLDPAFRDGTLPLSAMGGLRKEHVTALLANHAHLDVLVRLRGENGDARTVMSVKDFALWQEKKNILTAQGVQFTWLEIRDVSGVAR